MENTNDERENEIHFNPKNKLNIIDNVAVLNILKLHYSDHWIPSQATTLSW